MRKHALILAAGLATAGLASACVAQPAQDQPPSGYSGPPPGSAPGYGNGPPPGYSGPPPGGDTSGAPPGGAPGGAMSGPPGQGPHNMRARFDMANTTHDGRLTVDQAQASGWRAIAKNFGAIDTDHKGYVTIQDIRAFMRARRAARTGSMQAPPPGGMQGPPPGEGSPGPQGTQGPPPGQPQY